ncbi:class I SAM-dependent methyltransferase [Kitasatospora sp. NPDC002040]|uniref:class I SAM-dependent methyltransferase n=1 Tax=Kitasatospora sp. NPDC002040 TaxID=3154661 RepID=UPI00331D22AE
MHNAADTTPSTATPHGSPLPALESVPGWFFQLDQEAFHHLLGAQSAAGRTGDLLELGCYLGRSTVLLGHHLQPGEQMTVCDLFDSDAGDEENAAEMASSYRSTLTRRSFEANYLAFHPQLPVIHQAPTSALADGRVRAGSCRFVHVDASHLYEHVAGDIEVARRALAEDGVVVLDDYRSEHTPGVSAAVWEAVFTTGLRPAVLTPMKFYGTWGDPRAVQRMMLERDWQTAGFTVDQETIAGRHVVRLNHRPTPRTVPPRRLITDLLPPLLTRAIRKARRASGA